MNIQDLLHQVEHLPMVQLEKIRQYMEGRPYKIEGRAPTIEEQNEVIQALQAFIAESPPIDDDEARLAGLGDFSISDIE